MKKITIVMLAAAFCLVSCSDDEKDDKGGGNGNEPVGDIVIDPLITGNTEFSFATGDQIGLTVTKADGTAVAANAAVSYAGNLFTTDIEWYTDDASSQVTAYYPYSAAGAPATVSVATDQRDGYLGSEFLAASKAGVTPTVNAVSMTFESLLTRVTINVDNQSAADISAVILRGLVPYADVDLAALEITARTSGPAADITMHEAEAGATYVAMVIPQEVAFTIVVKTADGIELTEKINAATLEQGGVYGVQVEVRDDRIHAIDYEDFGDSFRYEGEIYKTVNLANGSRWMAQSLRYVPEGYTVSEDPTAESHIWYPYSTDGTDTTPLTSDSDVEERGFLYDIYAAFGGIEITEANCYDFEGIRGICPPGWHIPTRAEYLELVDSSTADAFGGGSIKNPDALFYDSGLDYSPVTIANEQGFNTTFSGTRMKANYTTAGSYQKTAATEANCEIEEWVGEPSINYHITSTGYKPSYNSTTGALQNIQFFSLNANFANSYRQGRLNIVYAHHEIGQQLRCIQD
ncbi:MAG: fimbrillin family protein [Alistipes sp.]|nr:fimbrillin family protein [Alistipes sp.]